MVEFPFTKGDAKKTTLWGHFRYYVPIEFKTVAGSDGFKKIIDACDSFAYIIMIGDRPAGYIDVSYNGSAVEFESLTNSEAADAMYKAIKRLG